MGLVQRGDTLGATVTLAHPERLCSFTLDTLLRPCVWHEASSLQGTITLQSGDGYSPFARAGLKHGAATELTAGLTQVLRAGFESRASDTRLSHARTPHTFLSTRLTRQGETQQ